MTVRADHLHAWRSANTMMVGIEYKFFQDQISLVLILEVHACVRVGRWLQRVFFPEKLYAGIPLTGEVSSIASGTQYST